MKSLFTYSTLSEIAKKRAALDEIQSFFERLKEDTLYFDANKKCINLHTIAAVNNIEDDVLRTEAKALFSFMDNMNYALDKIDHLLGYVNIPEEVLDAELERNTPKIPVILKDKEDEKI